MNEVHPYRFFDSATGEMYPFKYFNCAIDPTDPLKKVFIFGYHKTLESAKRIQDRFDDTWIIDEEGKKCQ